MECKLCERKSQETFECDGCNILLCKVCAGLTSSEIRVLQLKDRIMIFHCKECRDLKTISLLQDRIKDKLELISCKEELIDNLKSRIVVLEEKINTSPPPMVHNNISYSNATKGSRASADQRVNFPNLIIRPKKQQDVQTTNSDIKQKIDPAGLKIAIKGTRYTSSGNVIVKCNNTRDLEILKREAESKLKDYEISMTKMRKPRIKIVGYEGDLRKEEIEKCLRQQNDCVDEKDELKVTFIRNRKQNKPSIIYGECSSQLFHKFMAAKKINLDWTRCPVFEDVNISRCFKCQEHYHKSDKCPNDRVICEYCGGEHDTRQCPKTHKKCINCVKANERYATEYKVNHCANDTACPSYQYLLNVLKSKIDYGNGS